MLEVAARAFRQQLAARVVLGQVAQPVVEGAALGELYGLAGLVVALLLDLVAARGSQDLREAWQRPAAPAVGAAMHEPGVSRVGGCVHGDIASDAVLVALAVSNDEVAGGAHRLSESAALQLVETQPDGLVARRPVAEAGLRPHLRGAPPGPA